MWKRLLRSVVQQLSVLMNCVCRRSCCTFDQHFCVTGWFCKTDVQVRVVVDNLSQACFQMCRLPFDQVSNSLLGLRDMSLQAKGKETIDHSLKRLLRSSSDVVAKCCCCDP